MAASLGLLAVKRCFNCANGLCNAMCLFSAPLTSIDAGLEQDFHQAELPVQRAGNKQRNSAARPHESLRI